MKIFRLYSIYTILQGQFGQFLFTRKLLLVIDNPSDNLLPDIGQCYN